MTAWEVVGVLAVLVALAGGLLYAGKAFWSWSLPLGAAFGACATFSPGVVSNPIWISALAAYVIGVVVGGVPPIRKVVLTKVVMRIVGGILPKMGDTERIALEAGTVWWDGDLFSGDPKWKTLLDFKNQPLSAEEQAFLDGPLEELCHMVDDFQIEKDKDLSPETWAFVKKHRFLGMIIPKEYGGLGFSAIAHSSVVIKLSSRSGATAVSVMVPNSLGPAELLLHYGTDEQKKHYLPRLATGEEMPCFALTGPEAGSDAANTASNGVVCKGIFEGKEVLGMRLNWDKRYITLAPIATVIGLAFRLLDPDKLLGDKTDLGITCALIPHHLPGIDIGKRHDPLGNAFQNGPTWGKDVFVPLEYIIGGPPMAGQGWRMLMECLAAGRSISLPAVACAAAGVAVRGVGAYATVREQFDTPIGRFEGIEEPLARIGGFTYLMNAARVLTAGAVDAGEKPAVVSAIVKRWLTEAERVVVTDAMDILGGAAISQGPRNVIARGYLAVPIGITVEGANILTRCLIVFGQGAIRCHPFVQDEMRSIAERDLNKFDCAFWGHMGFVFKNVARSFVLGLTDGSLATPTLAHPEVNRYMGQLSRWSAAFALCSDVAMGTLGGTLKRAEKLSGRLADALAWQYLASATIKRYYDEGQNSRYLPFLQWSMEHALYEIQEALAGLLDNLPNRPAALAVRLVVFPTGKRYKRPSDALGAKIAHALLDDREERMFLSRDIFSPTIGETGLGYLEYALKKVVIAQVIYRKIKEAVKAGKLPKRDPQIAEKALAAGIITADELRALSEANEARTEAIQVDSFEPEELTGKAKDTKPEAVASAA